MDLMARIEKLIRRKDLCVLATTGENGPHTSLMAYACHPENLHLYLLTSTHSRKYRNISKNPLVSLLIDTREENAREQIQALTISGRVLDVDADERRRSLRDLVIARHPQLGVFRDQADLAVLQVVPEAFQLLEGVEKAHYLSVDRHRHRS